MKKRFIVILLIIGMVSALLCLTSCNDNSSDGLTNAQKIYAQAAELGYEGTYEEFIELVSGKDGVSVVKAQINENGDLIFILSDYEVINAGSVKGQSGADGSL